MVMVAEGWSKIIKRMCAYSRKKSIKKTGEARAWEIIRIYIYTNKHIIEITRTGTLPETVDVWAFLLQDGKGKYGDTGGVWRSLGVVSRREDGSVEMEQKREWSEWSKMESYSVEELKECVPVSMASSLRGRKAWKSRSTQISFGSSYGVCTRRKRKCTVRYLGRRVGTRAQNRKTMK